MSGQVADIAKGLGAGAFTLAADADPITVDDPVDDRYHYVVVPREYLVQVHIYTEDSGVGLENAYATVNVTRPNTRYGGFTASEVNWPSIGAVPRRSAEAFAEALALAVAVARRLDDEAGL